MIKKILWALIEVGTIGYGTYLFVSTMLNEEYLDHEIAGVGAFLIALGLLVRNWRMTLFITAEKKENDKIAKSEIQNRNVHTLLIIILSFTVFILNRKINDTKWDLDNNESEILNLEDKIENLDDIEYRFNNLESLEERVEHLERYSHGHY